MKLSDSNKMRLRTADGWLELGDHVDAFEELERVVPLNRAHPDVLKLRWRIYAHAERWDSAFALADGLRRRLPDDAECAVWLAYSARRTRSGGAATAYKLLRDVADEFTDEPLVSFNLACYARVLGRGREAEKWLKQALDIADRQGTGKQWRIQALAEEDLGPLRPEIRK